MKYSHLLNIVTPRRPSGLLSRDLETRRHIVTDTQFQRVRDQR